MDPKKTSGMQLASIIVVFVVTIATAHAVSRAFIQPVFSSNITFTPGTLSIQPNSNAKCSKDSPPPYVLQCPTNITFSYQAVSPTWYTAQGYTGY